MLYSLNELNSLLVPICKEYNLKEMYIFGSYARGEATDKSDIDIYVDSGLKGLSFYGLLERLTNKLGLRVDLIDRRDLRQGSSIEAKIIEEGVKIYGSERQRNIA